MDTNNFKQNVDEWLTLSNQGLFVEARKFYFENLFEGIIDLFVSKTALENHCDVLFSILGFSPEPIILTQRALIPSVHVSFTTNKENDNANETIAYLEKFLTSSYKLIHLSDESLHSIHEALLNQMLIYPASRYVIDITGGKKSMVASASIFGRNYNCDVVYVDYDQYIPDLRRPMPGTEKLNIVYSVQRDFIKLLDVEELKKIQSKRIAPSIQTIIPKTKVTFSKAYDMLKKAIDKEPIISSKIKLEYNDINREELVLIHSKRTWKVPRTELERYFQQNPKAVDTDKTDFGTMVGTEGRNAIMYRVITFLRKNINNT